MKYQYDLVVQGALAGQGVALGRLDLIRPLIEDGRLVWLSPPRPGPSTAHAYWLVRATEQQRPDVRRVAEWIEGQGQAAERGRTG